MKGKCVICFGEHDIWSMRSSAPLMEAQAQVVCYDCEPYILAVRKRKSECSVVYDGLFIQRFHAIMREAHKIKQVDEEERKKIRGLSI
jgi:hypothetical protein